jgi:hypothetical protein
LVFRETPAIPIQFLPVGLVGLLAAFFAWGTALFIFTQVPDSRIARRFALLLTLEGLTIFASWAGPVIWLTDLDQAYQASLLHLVSDSLLIALYLPTIAVVVNSPMVRIFATLPWALLPLSVGLCGAFAVLVMPESFMPIGNTTPGPEGWTTYFNSGGKLWPIIFLLLTLSYTYGFIATVLAWHSAESAVSKRKNGILAVAFGTRDIVWGGMFLSGVVQAAMGIPINPLASVISVHIGAIALIIYVLMTAYGIASAQLFDIDLKVKRGFQRGTVAAAYVAIFFVVSESAATILTDQIGTIVGLVATGLLLFALNPIFSMAVSLSDRAMPDVIDSDDYKTFKKLQIYGEAFAEAGDRGEVTSVGRAALNRLRVRLDLSGEDVLAVESELQKSAHPENSAQFIQGA